MTRILLVEDEEKLARFVELELTHEGYQVDKAFDGRTGLDMAEKGGYDLLLLDIMLPGLNGLEVLRRLRKNDDHVPVIMLTARDAVMDKVTGLDMGADDYVTKPFSIEELLARIRAALRKQTAQKQEENLLSCADLIFHGKQNHRPLPRPVIGKGVGLRLFGRDQRGGRVRALPARQDRRRL